MSLDLANLAVIAFSLFSASFIMVIANFIFMWKFRRDFLNKVQKWREQLLVDEVKRLEQRLADRAGWGRL